MSTYNGWTNKETWLVNLWYGDDLAHIIADDWNIYEDECEIGIGENEAEEWVRYIAEEVEVLSQPPKSGLLSDFLETCWAEVNWQEIAESVSESAKELAEE